MHVMPVLRKSYAGPTQILCISCAGPTQVYKEKQILCSLMYDACSSYARLAQVLCKPYESLTNTHALRGPYTNRAQVVCRSYAGRVQVL